MEIIINILIKTSLLWCFLFSMYFFYELYSGIKELIEKQIFTVNKKKLLRYAVLVLVFLVVDWQFSEKTTAWLGILLGLGVVVAFQIIGAILLKIVPKIIFRKIKVRKTISRVTSSGFVIKFDKGSISYDWNEVKSLTLNNMQLTIDFISKKRKLKIDDGYINYHYLLKNIPKGYPTMDYEVVEKFFNSLTTCPFCGLIAFQKGFCLACRCEDWDENKAKEYPNKDAYLRENQLEIFATTDRHESFSNFKMDSKPFVRDEEWKPIVSKQEVLQYSQKEYWDEE